MRDHLHAIKTQPTVHDWAKGGAGGHTLRDKAVGSRACHRTCSEGLIISFNIQRKQQEPENHYLFADGIVLHYVLCTSSKCQGVHRSLTTLKTLRGKINHTDQHVQMAAGFCRKRL